ncbi:RNA polymerase sigma factor [Kibdelosporangium aridum]|uniref:RNA polymerase sigma factor, sigma-70 family n=1 Tax=Kibdelosporangium aridum TaxID=2030 RepID=A0A1Y5XN38_KIBAR|nr:sigma-70 family RNA polymerase sigma factor [Kibdelosporangium aridum]SMD07974.1 RNA polymerase sigma factor, sigma-70 family [Kibdelosporangium aridum]
MVLTALVHGATRGQAWAWATLVQRYRPLVSAICRNLGITGVDADDVAGTVWLRLVANMTTIRDPEALPGWIVTTTRRECLQMLRDRSRQVAQETEDMADVSCPGPDNRLLVDERRDALREAIDGLSDRDQQLLSMLFADPPIPYAEISARLGMPIGAIGPTRQRCLARVRRSPGIAALLVNECHANRRRAEAV